MDSVISFKYIVSSIVYSGIGLLVYAFGFWLFEKVTPFQFWKEIVDEHNTALAIVVGAMSIGIALIIGSAIHG